MVEVLDLFAGMGGLASGLAKEVFSVNGYDIHQTTKEIFRINTIGNAEIKDLSSETFLKEADVVNGGPPCRPWSSKNLTFRKNECSDHGQVYSFFINILKIESAVFIMEMSRILERIRSRFNTYKLSVMLLWSRYYERKGTI